MWQRFQRWFIAKRFLVLRALVRWHAPTYGICDYAAFDAAVESLAHQRDFIEQSGFLASTGYHAKRKLRAGVLELTDALLRVPVEPTDA